MDVSRASKTYSANGCKSTDTFQLIISRLRQHFAGLQRIIEYRSIFALTLYGRLQTKHERNLFLTNRIVPVECRQFT